MIKNYSIFFPIQVWIHQSKKFRLVPPLLGTNKVFQFSSHFLDDLPNGKWKEKCKKEWKLKYTFWALNPSYGLFLGRGIGQISVTHKNQYPYQSFLVPFHYSITPIKNLELINIHQDFLFLYYKYTIPGTNILFINYDANNNIYDVVMIDEEGEKDDSNNIYNFLPFRKNKNVPFYEILSFKLHLFINIYKEKPSALYWKPTSESICIPTTDSRYYATNLECNFATASKTKNKVYYLGNTGAQIDEIMKYDEYKSSKIISCFLIVVFYILLAIVIVVTHK